MSLAVHVYLSRDKLGNRRALQQALESADLQLELPESFDPHQPQGFQHWLFEGRPVEFGYDLNDEPDRFPLRSVRAESRLAVELTVNTRSGEFGWRAASCLAAAIAVVSGGTVEDQQSGERFRGARAVQWAARRLEDLLGERALALPHVDSEFEHLRNLPWWRFW